MLMIRKMYENDIFTGVDITDYSSRRRNLTFQQRKLVLPTGMKWAATTTDGLLVYSQSDVVILIQLIEYKYYQKQCDRIKEWIMHKIIDNEY